MVGAMVAAVMVMLSACVPVPLALVALMVAANVPATVGIPEIKPVLVLMASPAGNPDALKLVGELVAVMANENAVPVTPLAVAGLLMAGAGGRAAEMVMLRPCVPVPATLVALMVAANVPATVGVPEIKPVMVLGVSPGGKPVALKLVGVFAAVMV